MTGAELFAKLAARPDQEWLRDYFAGQALAGLASRTPVKGVVDTDYATSAYQLADAMMAEREKRND